MLFILLYFIWVYGLYLSLWQIKWNGRSNYVKINIVRLIFILILIIREINLIFINQSTDLPSVSINTLWLTPTQSPKTHNKAATSAPSPLLPRQRPRPLQQIRRHRGAFLVSLSPPFPATPSPVSAIWTCIRRFRGSSVCLTSLPWRPRWFKWCLGIRSRLLSWRLGI